MRYNSLAQAAKWNLDLSSVPHFVFVERENLKFSQTVIKYSKNISMIRKNDWSVTHGTARGCARCAPSFEIEKRNS